MPMKPKRPCAYPGCPRLSDGRYCEEHRKLTNRIYERFRRDPETKRRYSGAWVHIRKQYVNTHPFCEKCLGQGYIVPVEHVHHIIPLSEGGTNEPDNLMSLCKSCHSSIHAKRGDYWTCGRTDAETQ